MRIAKISTAADRPLTSSHQTIADARGYREEALRARKLADISFGQLRGESLEIAALYEILAVGRDPDQVGSRFAYEAAHNS